MSKTHWTESDLKKIAKGVKVVDNYRPLPATVKEILTAHKEPEGKHFIELILNKHKIPFVKELKFCSTRKFRFDYALPQFKIAIEYEGLCKQHQGGHQSIEGFSNNCEKYNIACIEGWRLLRYTNRNFKNFENDLIQLLIKL